MYKGCIVSLPVMAYKDWRIQYDFKDNERKKEACNNVKKNIHIGRE